MKYCREFPNTWTLVGCACIAISTIIATLVKRVKPIRHVKFQDEAEIFGDTEGVVETRDEAMIEGGPLTGSDEDSSQILPGGKLTLK